MKFINLKNKHLGKCTITNAEGGIGAGNTGHTLQRAGVSIRYYQPAEGNRNDRSRRNPLPSADQTEKFGIPRLHLAGIIVGSASKILHTHRQGQGVFSNPDRIMEPACTIC